MNSTAACHDRSLAWGWSCLDRMLQCRQRIRSSLPWKAPGVIFCGCLYRCTRFCWGAVFYWSTYDCQLLYSEPTHRCREPEGADKPGGQNGLLLRSTEACQYTPRCATPRFAGVGPQNRNPGWDRPNERRWSVLWAAMGSVRAEYGFLLLLCPAEFCALQLPGHSWLLNS